MDNDINTNEYYLWQLYTAINNLNDLYDNDYTIASAIKVLKYQAQHIESLIEERNNNYVN